MEKIRRIVFDTSFVLLCLLNAVAVLLVAFVLYGSFEFYQYKFPAIANWGWLLSLIGVHVIAVLLVGTSVFFLIQGKRKISCVCLIIFIPAVIWCFMTGLSYGLYRHPIVSYTSDPDDFGVYDAISDMSLLLYPPEFYPDSIPDEAENVQYCYYYKNASAETTYMAIGWEADTLYLNQMAEQMEQSMEVENIGSLTIYRANYKLGSNLYKHYKNIVLIDYEKKQICFVVTTTPSFFPKTIDAAFTMPLN